MKMLIIGASGSVGGAIFRRSNSLGIETIGTYHKNASRSKELVAYDITRDDISDIIRGFSSTRGDKRAIICSAICNSGVCRREYDRAYHINVTSTKKLIDRLTDMGWHIIFCSSEAVYGDERGDYTEDDAVRPCNEYGQMKAEVEEYLSSIGSDACIFRLSKVFGDIGSSRDSFGEWRAMASAGETIRCIQGNIFNPVYVEDIARCVEVACTNDLHGIYNICSDKKYSRADLCGEFCYSLGYDPDIVELPLDAFGFDDGRPLDTSMINKKFTGETGYNFTPLSRIYDMYK